MKKAIVLLAIVLLGVGAYFGYYGVQRIKINLVVRAHKELEACSRPLPDDPNEAWFRTQACAMYEEETKELKQVAATSKTFREFHEKLDALLDQWNKKLEKLIEEYKKRKEQREKGN